MMLCDSAVRQGLFSLTVTDHCECNEYWDKGYNKVVLQSYFEARKAAAAFRGRLHVRAGIEMGQPLQDHSASEEALSLCDYDFVLASIHNIKDTPDFYDLDYTKCNIHEPAASVFCRNVRNGAVGKVRFACTHDLSVALHAR